MRDIFTVMKFTMLDMIKRKSFIISTIIILLLIIVGFNIPNIIKSVSDSDVKSKILIVDEDKVFNSYLEVLKNDSNYDIVIEKDSKESIKERIKNKEIDAGIIVNNTNKGVALTYIVDNLLFISDSDEILTRLNMLYHNIKLESLNLSEDEITLLNQELIVNYDQVEEEVNGNIYVMMILSIILFYAIYFCAFQVSSSITTEKTSKIIETLVTSTSPKNIVIGKTIGIGLVGLVQMILIVTTAFLSANFFVEPELLNMLLDTSSITFILVLITFIYFILGYFAFALLYALTGSTVSKPEDIQSANSPVALISVFSFYLSYFTMMNPTSSLNHFAALFPLSSAFCMPFRIMMGISDFKEVLLSLFILIITILIIAKVTIKIYSNAILNYGKKLNFKDIIKMAFEK